METEIRDFENGEMQLWLRNKGMIEENKGVPVLQVRKKAFCEYYKLFDMALNLNSHGVRV